MITLLIGYQWIWSTFPVQVTSDHAFWQAMWLTYSTDTPPAVIGASCAIYETRPGVNDNSIASGSALQPF